MKLFLAGFCRTIVPRKNFKPRLTARLRPQITRFLPVTEKIIVYRYKFIIK